MIDLYSVMDISSGCDLECALLGTLALCRIVEYTGP